MVLEGPFNTNYEETNSSNATISQPSGALDDMYGFSSTSLFDGGWTDGTNTLNLSQLNSGITIGSQQIGYDNNQVYYQVESYNNSTSSLSAVILDFGTVIGTNYGDTIYASNNANYSGIYGRNYGTSGINKIIGGSGGYNAFYSISGQNNTLIGGGGNNLLFGDISQDGYSQTLTGKTGTNIFQLGYSNSPQIATLSQSLINSGVSFLLKAVSYVPIVGTYISQIGTIIQQVYNALSPSSAPSSNQSSSDIVYITNFTLGKDIIALPKISNDHFYVLDSGIAPGVVDIELLNTSNQQVSIIAQVTVTNSKTTGLGNSLLATMLNNTLTSSNGTSIGGVNTINVASNSNFQTANVVPLIDNGNNNITLNNNSFTLNTLGTGSDTVQCGTYSTSNYINGQNATYDYLVGGNGSDTLLAGNGNYNTITDGNGNNDTLIVGNGNYNYLKAGNGYNDYLYVGGGTGGTLIAGNGNNDYLGAYGNHNSLIAGNGNSDTLAITGNGDTVIAGTGNDTLQDVSVNNTNNALDSVNILTPGGGADTFIAGVTDHDLFDYRTLTNSVLSQNNISKISNFNAVLDYFLVSNTISQFKNLGSVASLSQAGISSVLNATNFPAYAAAEFTVGTDTYVAINNSTAGFDSSKDAVIKVTGLQGNLSASNFTTHDHFHPVLVNPYLFNGQYELISQSDGNLVLYNGNTPLWASNTYGTGVVEAVMQDDGNFVLYNNSNQSPQNAVWSSGTSGNAGAYLSLDNHGNLAVVSNYETVLKSIYGSNIVGQQVTSNTQEILASDASLVTVHKVGTASTTVGVSQYQLDLLTGGQLGLFSGNGKYEIWSGNITGGTEAVMQTDGNFVIYKNDLLNSQNAVWSSNTAGLSGNPGAYLSLDNLGSLTIASSTGKILSILDPSISHDLIGGQVSSTAQSILQPNQALSL